MAITKSAYVDALHYSAENVLHPAFLRRLAAHGITPTNKAEALFLTKLGTALCWSGREIAPVGHPNPYESVDAFIKNAGDAQILNDRDARTAVAVVLQALVE